MTKAASDSTLAGLHAKLANTMKQALDAGTEAQYLLDKHHDLPDDVADYLGNQGNYNPALMATVIKFLKDNDITCQVEENAEMNDLERTLTNKRRRGKVENIPTIDTIQ